MDDASRMGVKESGKIVRGERLFGQQINQEAGGSKQEASLFLRKRGCYPGDVLGEVTGVAVGDGAGVRTIDATWLRSSSVTRPLRRYQIPSPVSHTSSASTLVPLVSRMTTVPPFNLSSAPVETGLELSTARAASVCAEGDGVALGEGDASGDGDTLVKGEGTAVIRGNDC